MKSMESEFIVTTLHLIFPFAEMDLADWMMLPKSPAWLQGLPEWERRAYLYRLIYAFVSGLSFLHREKDGTITAHHDLKPRNILVVGQELKIADFGRSHLRPLTEGSETEATSGLRTYEYHPPEYWNDDGTRAKVKHGRAFDIWSTGCIIIEIATLIVHGWESEKVLEFKRQREYNQAKTRPNLASQHKARQNKDDFSFHNNWTVVEKWIYQLQVDDDSQKMSSTLKVARGMMNKERSKRLYAWEAELDLYNIQHPNDDRIARLEIGALCVQASPPRANLIGTQTPFHRVALIGDRTRLRRLHEAGWSMFVTDDKGLTPREIFKQNHHADLFDLLPNIEGNEKQGQELLEAAERGNVDKVRDLLGQGVDAMFVDQENRSALYIAAKYNQGSVAKCLLQAKGQDLLRQRDKEFSDTPLHKAASRNRAKMVLQFLEWSLDLEDKQRQGKTALFLAVEYGHYDTIDILLEHRALVFTQANNGGTPIHDAVEKNRQQVLRRLLTAPDASKCLEHKN